MTDPLNTYQAFYRLVGSARADPIELVKLGLLIVVVVAVGWRLVFAWLDGAISGPEAFVLTISLLLAEMAAVRWLPDFQGVRFILLLALPGAAWLGVQAIAGVLHRESYRSDLDADARRFRAALRRDPRNVAAHELLGDTYLKLGQSRRAITEYRTAVALDPGSYQNRYKLERAVRLSSLPRRTQASQADTPA
jgi:tetratricopeptide (TPR) repeat protein